MYCRPSGDCIANSAFGSSDAFNPSTFFQLHDLDRNGILDRGEIEAIYGVHHVYSKRKTPSEEAQAAKAKQVADAVLAAMDANGDGFITMEEFLAKGLDALPDFSSLGAEGHHYDVESGESFTVDSKAPYLSSMRQSSFCITKKCTTTLPKLKLMSLTIIPRICKLTRLITEIGYSFCFSQVSTLLITRR